MTKPSSALKRIVRYASAGVLLVVIVGYLAYTSENEPVQPLVYNHQVHVENAGLVCADCHNPDQSPSTTTIPSIEICSSCHSEEPLTESPEEKKLLQFVAEKSEIPWKRIYSVPDHVYFSHRRHVTKAGLECKVCHGDVPQLTKPITAPFVPVTMENCMKCHRENNVTNDCLSCHR